jgi:uncharacterized protein
MDNPKVVVRKTKQYGRGVFAKKRIKKGEVIAEVDGKIYELGPDENELPNKPPLYVMDHAVQFADYKWRLSKGIAKYINHSCEPNCGIRKLFKIVAMRTIEPGEEITWDYDMAENSLWFMRCKCHTKSCRKWIRGYDYLPTKFRRKYKGYISEWLLSA